MGHLPFSKPVFLKLHPAGNFQVPGPLEAVEYLEHWWPAERTPHYRQAKVLCHAAVDGTVQPETARVALIDAANRAGVLAEPREVNSALANTTYAVGHVVWSGELGDVAEELEVTDDDMVGYHRAGDILDDPSLSPSRKRALLAYWASDVHTVAGSPAFRRLRDVTISIDSILDALCSLDAEVDQAAMAAENATAGRSW